MAKKSKKTEATDDTKKKKGSVAADSGLKERLNEEITTKTFKGSETDTLATKYVERRIDEMSDFRRMLGIEARWREADEEYVPHELDFGTTRKRFETDQDSGLRSRMVPVGDVTQQWRQASSAPTLLAKIQTAMGIIVDQQPEGELVAMGKKFAKRTAVVYAAWKRNWQITNAKEKLKVLVFDLAKYGWAAQRTFPRKIVYKKNVLVETDPANPENDRYEEKELVWFNDVDRQNLSVFTTWIDELAKPYDPYSINEEYFELDLSYDGAKVEFGKYPNFEYVNRNSQMIRNNEKRKSNRTDTGAQLLKRQDIVTIGFFESRHKDLYVIWAPKDKIPLFVGPLPNDDGMLQIVQTMWILRKSNLPYGVSLWEIIRQNKQLYDKMKNMTMDQLVLSIMKFGFFSGTNVALGDGKIEIVPGQARQITTSSGDAKNAVNWMEIPGPGEEAWKGIEAVQAMMDDESGISPSLEGEVTGKTLGEILHAKDAALKRMKVPVDNICWGIEQDAYLTISWMSQLYSIPEVKEFESIQDMQDYESDEETEHSGDIFAMGVPDEDTGAQTGPFKAQYYPQLALHLEDSDGQLHESKDSKYYQLGVSKGQIQPGWLKWRGIFKVIPRSIIDTSQDLIKAMKMELFNILIPLLQQPPELVANAARQIIVVNEEDPEDWLPETWIQYLNTPAPQPGAQQTPPGMPGAPAGAQPGGMMPGQPQPGAQAAPGGAGAMPQPGGNSMQAASGLTPPQAATIVPGTNMPSIAQLQGGKPGAFGRTL